MAVFLGIIGIVCAHSCFKTYMDKRILTTSDKINEIDNELKDQVDYLNKEIMETNKRLRREC